MMVGLRNGVACPRCRTLPDRSADELFLLCRARSSFRLTRRRDSLAHSLP